eukprot:scaffold326842_cov24-Prasinocladus_malaysianus.AAC.1
MAISCCMSRSAAHRCFATRYRTSTVWEVATRYRTTVRVPMLQVADSKRPSCRAESANWFSAS